MKDPTRAFRQGPSKGGLNSPPTEPRPPAPKGQGGRGTMSDVEVIKDFITERIEEKKELATRYKELLTAIGELEVVLEFVKEIEEGP